MTIDLDKLSPSRRARATRTGAAFTHDQVQRQSGKTLKALDDHEATLAEHGFIAADRALLAVLLALGKEQAAARVAEETARKGIGEGVARGIREGKNVRLKLRTMLGLGLDALELDTLDAAGEAALESARGALSDTSSAGADPTRLAEQLIRLCDALELAPIAPVVAARGAVEAAAAARPIAAALLNASEELGKRSASSPVVARGDLIEGLAVELLRGARRAARAAASAQRRPELAQAFELDQLYS
jgi:hypothetical protein